MCGGATARTPYGSRAGPVYLILGGFLDLGHSLSQKNTSRLHLVSPDTVHPFIKCCTFRIHGVPPANMN